MAAEVPPLVLGDEHDEGYCEERGWVEATVSEDEAADLLAESCFDDDGQQPARPVDPPKRVWLKPDEHGEVWLPCEPEVDGAVEFFEFDATATEPAPSKETRS